MIWNLEAKISQDTKKFDCFDLGYPRSLKLYNCHSWNASQWNRMATPQQLKCTSFSTSIYYEGGRHCNRWKGIFNISQSKVAPKNSMFHAKHSQTSAVLCAQNFHPCHFADMPCPSGQATQRPPAWKLDLADLQDAPCGDPDHATSQRLCGDKACYLWDIYGIFMGYSRPNWSQIVVIPSNFNWGVHSRNRTTPPVWVATSAQQCPWWRSPPQHKQPPCPPYVPPGKKSNHLNQIPCLWIMSERVGNPYRPTRPDILTSWLSGRSKCRSWVLCLQAPSSAFSPVSVLGIVQNLPAFRAASYLALQRAVPRSTPNWHVGGPTECSSNSKICFCGANNHTILKR